ncbi:MAG TPA: hypothetical protein PK720_00620 [bacterium]|nr:hypothetical protein [bacterium]
MSFFTNLFGKKKPATSFPGVIIAKIISVEPHPNADRLRIAKVNIGQPETAQIVCGAPNIEVGQLVPLATIGTILPNGVTIKAATIRGVESAGMLCATDELGIGSDHSGIKILSAGVPGEAIDAYL